MGSPRYDVFLSYNSADRSAVEYLAGRLRECGIEPWLDVWHLIPGNPAQEELEKALAAVDACAVFIGPGGLGPWQTEEMRAAIDRRVSQPKKRLRVIPALLPGAEEGSQIELPDFLRTYVRVEFGDSLDHEKALDRLVCGIRGIAPDRGPGDAIVEGTCPYKGLRCFDEADAPLFFGRTALTERLVDKLRKSLAGDLRFLAVIGPSREQGIRLAI